MTMDDSLLNLVARAAQEAGLTVQQVPSGRPRQAMRRRVLVIDDYECRVHDLKRVYCPPGSTRLYGHLNLSRTALARYDARIVCVAPPGLAAHLFVVPGYLLERIAGSASRVFLYFPVECRSVYHNLRLRVDWWKYEDAWHLLEGE